MDQPAAPDHDDLLKLSAVAAKFQQETHAEVIFAHAGIMA